MIRFGRRYVSRSTTRQHEHRGEERQVDEQRQVGTEARARRRPRARRSRGRRRGRPGAPGTAGRARTAPIGEPTDQRHGGRCRTGGCRTRCSGRCRRGTDSSPAARATARRAAGDTATPAGPLGVGERSVAPEQASTLLAAGADRRRRRPCRRRSGCQARPSGPTPAARRSPGRWRGGADTMAVASGVEAGGPRVVAAAGLAGTVRRGPAAPRST